MWRNRTENAALGARPSWSFISGRQGSRRAALADFLHQQFGVQTLANFGRLWNSDEETTDEANAPYAVETLKEDETLARLASGIKRFKLPDEFNFLRIYHETAASGNKPEAERR